MARVRGDTDAELRRLRTRRTNPIHLPQQQPPPRAPPSARRLPPAPTTADTSSPRTAPPYRVAATLPQVSGEGPPMLCAPAVRRRVLAPPPFHRQEAVASAATLQRRQHDRAEAVAGRAQHPTRDYLAKGPKEVHQDSKDHPLQTGCQDSSNYVETRSQEVEALQPLQQVHVEGDQAAAGHKRRRIGCQDTSNYVETRSLLCQVQQQEVEALQPLLQAHTKGDQAAVGHKRRTGDGHVSNPKQLRLPNPLDQLIHDSLSSFSTNNPKDLTVIRNVLMTLPKGPRSALHIEESSVDSRTSAVSVEINAYDVVGPDLARYGCILSNPWRIFWEHQPLVLHDTEILLAARSVRGRVNFSQRITALLQRHPGPVRYFRIDSSLVENAEQLEEWFEMLKVKKIQEVVFVNCRWPIDMVDFPINSLDCESLEQIRLCFVKISNTCLNYVKNLKMMDLSCCSMTTLDLYALVHQCTSLRELSIGIYEGDLIRIDSASLEILHVWKSTIRKLAVQNAAKLRKVMVEADPQKTVVVAAGPKKPSPCVGVWISDAPILTDACFNTSTQLITINNISTMTDNGPLSNLRKLILHISLGVKKEKKVLENFMKSCLRLRELTLLRKDKACVDEYSDALNDDWPAKLRNLSCILNLQLLIIKDYKGGDTELAIASAVLEYAPSLHQLILETNANDEEIFTSAKTKLREVTQASAIASVKYLIGLRDCNSFFSDGG